MSGPEAGSFPADLVPEVATSTWTEGSVAPAAPAEASAVSMESGGEAFAVPAVPPLLAETPPSTAGGMAGTPEMPAAPAVTPSAFEPPAAEPPAAEPAPAAPPAPESAPAPAPSAPEPSFGVPAMSQPPAAVPEQSRQPYAAPEQASQPPASAPVPPPTPGAYPPGYPYPAPAQGQPPAPGYSQYGYGQPAAPSYPAPSYPMYGQPAAPSYPMYGQPAPGSVPMMPAYGQPAPGSVPFYPQPGMMQPPARKTNIGLIVGIVALVVVLVIAVIGTVLLLRIGAASPTPQGPPVGATATSAAAATATAGLNVVFQDSLLSNANGWADDSHCSFQSDGYHVKDGYICYAPAGNFTDSTVSVQVKQVAGDVHYFYGLVLRRGSQGNFYEFDIDGNGKWAFGKVVNGTYTEIVPFVAHSAIKRGLNATNTLSVTASSTHFLFFVNGTQVGQADDSTFSSGYCGVEGDDHLEVVFTNFTIATPR